QKDYREEYLKNLVESVPVIDTDKEKLIVEQLQKQPKIFLFAKGLSKEIMRYIRYLYNRAGFFVIFPEDHHTRSIAQKQVKKNDIAIICSYKG
ncbi:MurR/RpiR family transcriptional regulator, partial [Enterococcus faecium]